MNDEIGFELELILKNRELLNKKYYNYLIERVKKERYFKIGEIEFSFRKAKYFDGVMPCGEVLSLNDIPKNSSVCYMEFDIKYNDKCNVLVLDVINSKILILVRGDEKW